MRKKKFASIITLTSDLGVVSKVTLTGPEPEVRYVAAMFTLGVAANKANITHETIELAKRHAIEQVHGIILKPH